MLSKVLVRAQCMLSGANPKTVLKPPHYKGDDVSTRLIEVAVPTY